MSFPHILTAAQVELGQVKKVAPAAAVAADKQGTAGAGTGGEGGASAGAGAAGVIGEGRGEGAARGAGGSPVRGGPGVRGTSRLGDRGSPVPSATGSPRTGGAYAKPARH